MPGRLTVAGFRIAPDRPWPTFEEDGKLYVNRYLRPSLPEDGDARIGHKFLEVLLPDERERTWFKQRLCHKLKHPEVPGPAVVMVARGKYGVGRDSFYALLEAMFGEQYISKPSFDMVTNQGSQGQFNDWLADSIWALVDETLSTDSNRYQRRHEAFEALKRNFEPARKRRDIKRKYLAPETMLCGPGGIFATNDPQPLAIADEDRRFTFLTNGEVQQPAFYVDLHAWMSVPGNVGAFRRDLEAVSLKGFNAYASLSTRLKDMIIADSKSELDEAVAAAVERALPGAVFSIRQVCEAVQAMVRANSRDWPDSAPCQTTGNSSSAASSGASITRSAFRRTATTGSRSSKGGGRGRSRARTRRRSSGRRQRPSGCGSSSKITRRRSTP